MLLMVIRFKLIKINVNILEIIYNIVYNKNVLYHSKI